jgi:hypothetical protein
MTKKNKFNFGNGAVVTVLARLVKPKRAIKAAFPNMHEKKRISGILRRKDTVVNGNKTKIVYMFQCDEVMNGDVHVELSAVSRFFEGITEGPINEFYNAPQHTTTQQEGELPDSVLEAMTIFGSRRASDDEIEEVRAEGVLVDDDNAPAPENIPSTNTDINHPECVYSSEWGSTGLCHRKMFGSENHRPKLLNFSLQVPTHVDMFELLFPKEYVNDTILHLVNKNIDSEKTVTYGEFIRWLGCWFLMATIEGPQRQEFWAVSDVQIFKGAPFRLTEFMSGKRFTTILKALEFTLVEPPNYNDKFHQIRDLVDAWNKNMANNFCPGWINCLDESMSVWSNPWTCPGFMFVPRKPHPFGNEWHTICCRLSGILFAVELVEGKDAPPEKQRPEFDDLGKTVGLLLRLTRSLWNTAKVVVLDSGFCVLKGIIELRKKGVFAAAVVKKRKYWPKYIKGDVIKAQFDNKELGSVDMINGMLEGVPFNVVALKDVKYTSIFMATYGTTERIGKETHRTIDDHKHTFKYPEVMANHYMYRHYVDDHNKLRHQPISLEEIWATKHWTKRVFAFLLAITEVNVMLAMKFFYKKAKTNMIEFRKEFAEMMIYNKYLLEERLAMNSPVRRSKRLCIETDHDLLTLPKKTKFYKTTIVESKTEYAQNQCSGCKKKTRTYCRCSPGLYRCKTCYAKHYASLQI